MAIHSDIESPEAGHGDEAQADSARPLFLRHQACVLTNRLPFAARLAFCSAHVLANAVQKHAIWTRLTAGGILGGQERVEQKCSGIVVIPVIDKQTVDIKP